MGSTLHSNLKVRRVMAYTNPKTTERGTTQTLIMRAIRMISRAATPPFQLPRGNKMDPTSGRQV